MVELHVADADALALQGVPMVQRGIPRIFFADPRWLRARYRMSIYTRMLRSEHGHWVRVNFVHHVYVYIYIYIYTHIYISVLYINIYYMYIYI